MKNLSLFGKLIRRIDAVVNGRRPAASQGRMYHAAQTSRLTSGWATSQTSADAELQTSLRPLRQRSRAVIRDAGFGKRAKTIVVNNVVGSGIGVQAQVMTTRGELNKRINADIEAAWADWSQAENCHTGGRLHFSALEQFAMGQVFEAGEIFIRKHYRPFGRSGVPYALEVIEPERVIDQFQPSPLDPAANIRMGVEVDQFFRPVAYWIRTIHPGESQLSPIDVDRIERVPADQIIHLAIIDRWPQTRGIPWMHAAMRKINDADGYTEAEIVRARDQANTPRALKTNRDYGDEVRDSSGAITREIVSSPGETEVLYADEEMQYPAPTSPNSSAESFLRFMLREIAAGIGVSYESLSRDYSQSNYSSSRLALLDDRDLWRIFQTWFIQAFRQPVHREWLQAAVLSRTVTSIPIDAYALDPAWYARARFKPRGWSWVDPTKEVEAYKEAIKAGLTTRTDVISKTADGRDVEDIDDERSEELKSQKEKGLIYDTDPDVFDKQPVPAKPQDPKQNDQTTPQQGGKKNGNGK